MRPQKAQTAQHDQLDAAIDHVAARMVAVRDDPDMLLRIASALPPRSSRLGWLIPQFAALSVIVVAAVWWSMGERLTAPAVLPSTVIAGFSVPPGVSARGPEREPEREPEPEPEPRTSRTKLSEPPAPSEPPEPLRSDFDRALPALELSVIGPAPLAIAESLTLAPLEIGELPLTAEAVVPNQF